MSFLFKNSMKLATRVDTSTPNMMTSCPICRQTFNHTYYRPMTLQCLHCFCEPCVAQMLSTNKNKKLTCSLCRKQTKLAKDKAADCLPINYAILDAMGGSNNGQNGGVASVKVNNFQKEEMSSKGKTSDVTVVPVLGMVASNGKNIKPNEVRVSRYATNSEESSTSGNRQTSNDQYGDVVYENDKPFQPRKNQEAQQKAAQNDGSSGGSMTSTVKHMSSGIGQEVSTTSSYSSRNTSSMTSTTSVAFTDGDNKPKTVTVCVTSVNSKSQTIPPKPSAVPISPEQDSMQPVKNIDPSDLCIRCNINPAQLSVANARAMKSQKLCTKCYLTDQQPSANQIDRRKFNQQSLNDDYNVCSESSVVPPANIPVLSVFSDTGPNSQQPSKTIIKVTDEQTTNKTKESTSRISTYVDRNFENNTVAPTGSRNDARIKKEDEESTKVLLKMLEEYKSNLVLNEKSENNYVLDRNVQNIAQQEHLSVDVSAQHQGRDTSQNVGRAVSTLIIQPNQGTRDTEFVLKHSPNEPETEFLEETEEDLSDCESTVSTVIPRPAMNLTTTINLCDDGDSSSMNSRPVQYLNESPSMAVNSDITRPYAFNPLYRSNSNQSFPRNNDTTMSSSPAYQLRQTDNQTPPYPINFLSKADEIQHNERTTNGDHFTSAPSYPATAPPRYEDVIKEDNDLSHLNSHASFSSDVIGGIRCVNTFGKYGELSTQPGAFSNPTRISVSSRAIAVVVDTKNMTVQAFTPVGECMGLFRVPDVNGCCCLGTDRLVAATNRGIEIYDFNGVKQKSISLGPVANAVCKGSDFIAVQQKSLSVFNGSTAFLVQSITLKSKQGTRQREPFENIVDVAVNSEQDLVVLDAGAAGRNGSIEIISQTGLVKRTILPHNEPCGRLNSPTSLAVDSSDNVIVSDSQNKRVLLFGPTGNFIRCLLGPGLGLGAQTASGGQAWPAGLDVSNAGQLFVVARGDRFAEIRVFVYNP